MSEWPITIFKARYQGVYEGGKWVALSTDNVPEDAVGGDIECVTFYSGEYEGHIGVGDNPNAALLDLRKKIADGS